MMLPHALSSAGQIEHIDITHANGVYSIDLNVLLDARLPDVYSLVTDFAGTARLNDSIVRNEVQADPENARWKRAMTIESCVWFFCFEVQQTEWLTIKQLAVIGSIIPEESNLGPGQSRWALSEPSPEQTRVLYTSEIRPEFWLPPLVGPYMLRKALRKEVHETVDRIETLARDESTFQSATD